MPPPMISTSTFLTRLASSSSLPDTFAPPTIAASGRTGELSASVSASSSFCIARPAVGRQLVGEAFGRGVGAVGGGEGVVDVDVAELGELGDELRLVLLFRLVEAGVLEAEHVAVLHRRDRLGGGSPMQSAAKATGRLTTSRHRRGDRPQREGRVRLALGTAEMGHQDDLAALVGDLEDRRRDALDAGRVGDLPVFDGNVEVDAQQHALALHLGGIESAERGHRQGSMRRPAAPSRQGRR